MTRWMLLALVACASAQNADRTEVASKYLRKQAEATHSPILSALALKVATASEGSALTKVIKFIDEAYNNIQAQIEKETAEDARCDNLIAESNAKLNKLNRDQMNFESATSRADTEEADAVEQVKLLQSQLDDNQVARSDSYNAFMNTKSDFDGELDHLAHNHDQLDKIAAQLKTAVQQQDDEDKRKGLAKGAEIFSTMVTRTQEQIDATSNDLKQATKEFQEYAHEDDREQKNLNSGIEHQTAKKQDANAAAKAGRKSSLANGQKLTEEKKLRKAIDSECVKTSVNHEDRMAQRQSEIDSLKQVKEILSQ